jgi:hypothetical protein
VEPPWRPELRYDLGPALQQASALPATLHPHCRQFAKVGQLFTPPPPHTVWYGKQIFKCLKFLIEKWERKDGFQEIWGVRTILTLLGFECFIQFGN